MELGLPVESIISIFVYLVYFVWVLWSKRHQLRFTSTQSIRLTSINPLRLEKPQHVSSWQKIESIQYYCWHKCDLTSYIRSKFPTVHCLLNTISLRDFGSMIFESRMPLEIFLFWHSIFVHCFKFNEEKFDWEWESPEIGWCLISFYFCHCLAQRKKNDWYLFSFFFFGFVITNSIKWFHPL